MKRVFAILLVILSISSSYVSASDIILSKNEMITPNYVQINVFDKRFDMLPGGKTSYYANLYSAITNDVRLYGFIQQYKNGNWTTLYSISDLASNGDAIIAGYYNVPSGYDYRFKVYGYAYVDGSMVESVTWISQSESY